MFVINICHYLVPDTILQGSLVVLNDKSHKFAVWKFLHHYLTTGLWVREWVSVSAKKQRPHID